MARRRNKGEERAIAQRRIHVLLHQARERPSFANRYAQLARRIAMRYQMKLDPAAKAQVCKACNGYNAAQRRVRIHNSRLITTCLLCGDTHRRPL